MKPRRFGHRKWRYIFHNLLVNFLQEKWLVSVNSYRGIQIIEPYIPLHLFRNLSCFTVTSVPLRKSSTTGTVICYFRQPRITTRAFGIPSMVNDWALMRAIKVSSGLSMSTGKQNISCLALVITCSWFGMFRQVRKTQSPWRPFATTFLFLLILSFYFVYRQNSWQNWD